MYKHILETAGNINWMALFALVTFVFVFTLAFILVFFKSKSDVDRVARMPLED